ncbi:hypothetical protein K469DRAFT_689937 [Zopfia rhizophila CBS 207.26]|uniref:Uncharacterized protein n=1 Tax=Zopfia rhizophila CBS 207.26 TaxID=1314779 RepID=A0A6A6DYL7_9PEZI|nr:hypothetical protein K469DRAFT_689937 [Zopfia rhizophila CBS 207.26]
MAEPVSSVLTLTTVSLVIIRKTAKFIQEAKDVDVLVQRLGTRLEDLGKVIKLVGSTCPDVDPRRGDPASFIREALTRCRNRLREVETLVKSLASQRSRTFVQRVVLKIKSDRSKKEIEEAIQDIERLHDQIHQAINCWNHQIISSIDRRTSEANRVALIQVPSTDLPNIEENEAVSPLSGTWSEAETAYETSIESRRTSTATRTSISSSSTRPRRSLPERDEAVLITDLDRNTEPVKKNSDWVEFHYQISVCDGNETRIRAIKEALDQHPERSRLVNSTDGSQRSPLHLAAQRGNVKLAKILLDFSADINAKDSQPCSVLDLAVSENKDAFVEFLLENNVDESAISKQNQFRFEEMKEAFELKNKSNSKSQRTSRKKTLARITSLRDK